MVVGTFAYWQQWHKEMGLKMLSTEWQPFIYSLNVLWILWDM